MNERIQELWEEAAKEHYGDTWEQQTAFMDKFAKLIVRECAKFLEENSGYDDCNNAWHPEPEDLLEHFGVES